MKSWKTTTAGALLALGTYLATVTDPKWVSMIGKGLAVIAPFLLGMTARDNDKSSEDVGAK